MSKTGRAPGARGAGWGQAWGRWLGLALSLAVGSAFAAEEPPADLLRKLAEHDARVSRAFDAGAVTVRAYTEELDSDGKVKTAFERVARVSHPGGQQKSELIRAVRDGKDVLEQEKGNEGKRRDARAMASSPFRADQQGSYRFHVLGPDKGDPALVRIAFGPRGKASAQLAVGEAVVDPVAGELVAISGRPAENPHFVDRAEFFLRYGARTSAGRTLTEITMDGEGGMLFIHKRMRAKVTFSDFDFPPPPSP